MATDHRPVHRARWRRGRAARAARTTVVVALVSTLVVAVAVAGAGPAAASPGAAPLAPAPAPAFALPDPQDPYAPAELAPPSLVAPAPWLDAGPAAPRRAPRRLQVAASAGLRFTATDTHDAASVDRLTAYGWPSARSPVMPVLGAEVQYLLAPIIDVGLVASWARADHAAGLAWADDRVTTTTTQLALVARLHWAMGRPFIPEPRVDVGVVRRTVELHGVPAADSLPYLRAGVDWRLGNRTGGVQLSAGYALTGRAASGRVDPAVAGLDVSLGPYLRF